MLTRINKHRDEAGFTLIELLVVVIIIGILAAIAIPVFLNQRNSARNASVQSDLRTVANEVETFYTQNQAYPGSKSATDASKTMAKPPLSPNNSLVYTIDGTTGTNAGKYKIVGCNLESGVVYTYDSDGGGILATTTPGGCGDTAAAGLSGSGIGS